MASISFEGKHCQFERGRTVFDHADQLGVPVPTSCGRKGTCHECVVEIKQGGEALTARTAPEDFLRGNFRLACQAVVNNTDRDIEFALLSRNPKILTTAAQTCFEIDPLVTRGGGKVFYDGEMIDVDRGHLYGVAADVGTTTIVMELVDLEMGTTVWVSSMINPQRFGGSDVMNRISYDGGPHHGELHKSVINTINHELKKMCVGLGIERQQIYEMVVVGNSTMRDLFFNLDVQSIGQRPYKLTTEHEMLSGGRASTAITEFAHRLGILMHPKARIFGGPLVASHIGADLVADLLAIDIESQRETVMLVDVGTNTEVAVGHAGRLVCASCPAGPAFEGGGLITYGMMAGDGAIEALRLEGDRWDHHVIGSVAPVGICGSGLIDLMAELRRAGRMTPKGVFAGKAREVVVAPEQGITFSRADGSNLAQAKAANYCGQLIALRKFGVRPSELDKLYLAGGFANYLNVANAVEIGFLAPVPEDRVVRVGNASIAGAKQMLLSRRKRQSIEAFVKRAEHVELETTPDFFEAFIEGCQFKPMPDH